MRPEVLAQCVCCFRLLLPHPCCWQHQARHRIAVATQAGRPSATGKESRCDGSRSTAARWVQTMRREPATTTLSAGTTSSNVALTAEPLATNTRTGFRLHEMRPPGLFAPHGWSSCHCRHRRWSIHLEPRPGHQACDQEQAVGGCHHQAPLQRDQCAAEHLLDLFCDLGLSFPNSVEARYRLVCGLRIALGDSPEMGRW